MPDAAGPPIWITIRKAGSRAACNRPDFALANSGRSVLSISMYWLVLNEVALTIAAQPTFFSANSSSLSR